MEVQNSKWHFLKLDLRKIIVILLLFFTPSILKLLGLTIASQYVLSGYLMYLVFFVVVIIFGIPFASPTNLPGWYQAEAFIVALIATPIMCYVLICALIAVWDKIFDKLCGKRSRLCQAAVLIILLVPFAYQAIYLPSLTSSRFTVAANTHSEISISADPRTFYDKNGPFKKYALKEFVVRNDNNFEMTHEVLREAPVMCLYNTQSGALKRYGGYYSDEKGHGFVDPPNWNKIILAPQSEVKYYLLGDTSLTDGFDKILMPEGTTWEPNKDCDELTKEDIDKYAKVKIKISR